MTYDLGDAVKWEFVFPITDKPVLGLPHLDDGNIYLDDEEVKITFFFLCKVSS